MFGATKQHTILCALVTSLLVYAVPVYAMDPAEQFNNGYLYTDDMKFLYDWEVAGLIDELFEDGSRGDGVVNSNIAMFFTQCYGGDWHDNFNTTTGENAGGLNSDLIVFNQAVTLSASSEGKPSYYRGYHAGASAAFNEVDVTTIGDVHLAGINTKFTLETPIRQNLTPTTIGGATSTHVLVWAGDPNDEDRQDITNLVNTFPESLTQTITVLAGDGSTADGTAAVNGAATEQNFKDALAIIGQFMDDGTDEQFILFVTDHGGLSHMDAFPVLAPADTFGGGTGTVTISEDTLLGMAGNIQAQDPDFVQVEPSISLFTAEDPSVNFNPNLVGVDFQLDGGDSNFVGFLSDSMITEEITEDGTLQNVYTFDIDPLIIEGLLLDFVDSPAPVDFTINISNFNITEDVLFDAVFFNTGSVAKLTIVPEPSTASALAVICLSAGLRCRLLLVRRVRIPIEDRDNSNTYSVERGSSLEI